MQRFRRQSGAPAQKAALARARRSRQERLLSASGRSPVVKGKTLSASGKNNQIFGLDRQQAVIAVAVGVGAFLIMKYV